MAEAKNIFEQLKAKLEETFKKKNKDKEEKGATPELTVSSNATEQKASLSTESEFSPKTINDVLSSLIQIENKYSSGPDLVELPDKLELTRLDEPTKTKDEISTEVETDLQSKFNQLKNQVENTVEREKEGKEAERITAENKSLENEGKANSLFDQVRIKTENDALRRGLARSSIVLFELSGIEEGRAKELLSIQKTLSDELAGIENQLAKLDRERQSSLETLDLEYASELTGTINQKVKELEEKRQEIIEYNNKVSEIEAEFNLDLLTNKSKLEADQADYRSKKEKEWEKSKLDEKFLTVNSYLNTLPKKEALQVLVSNSAIAEQLGSRYYELYYTQMAR